MASCVIGLGRSSRYVRVHADPRPEPGTPAAADEACAAVPHCANVCRSGIPPGVLRRARRQSGPQSQGRPAPAGHRTPGQRRRLARSGAAGPAYRDQRVQGGRVPRRGHLGRRAAPARAFPARSPGLVRPVFDLAAQGSLRTRRGRARRLVRVCERPRSVKRPAHRAGRRRAAGRVARRAPVQGSHLPQPDQLDRRRGRRFGVGGARVPAPAGRAAGAAPVGCHRRALPAGSPGSGGRLGNAPEGARAASRLLEQ